MNENAYFPASKMRGCLRIFPHFYFKAALDHVSCSHVPWLRQLFWRTVWIALYSMQKTALNVLRNKTIERRQSLGRTERLLSAYPFLGVTTWFLKQCYEDSRPATRGCA